MHSITHNTEAIAYSVKRTRRKSIAIRVYPDGAVVVSAPLRARVKDIQAVVEEKAAWIYKHYMKREEKSVPDEGEYVSGKMLRYLGKLYPLQVERSLRNYVQLQGDVLQVEACRLHPEGVRKQVQEWYKDRARAVCAERMQIALEKVRAIDIVHDGQFTLRKMRSRWGSCSSDGKITLNESLIYTPESCVDYVILHELCHLRELNHSKAYYALLSKVCPDWKLRRKEINNIVIS